MKEKLLKYYHALKNSQNHWLRKIVGVALVVFGLLGIFLPVFGIWMLPLGLTLLAVDFPIVRRFNQRALAAWHRLRKRFSAWRAARKQGRSEHDR
jgi:uncharacterized membrane protein HdeD (DUF308 family)